MNTKSIFYLFLSFCCQFLCAQNYIYKEFGITDGLPSLETHQLHQDKNGIIWIATDRGVASYNGYEIKTYGVGDGLTDIVILDLYPQKDGTIYCATFNNQLFYFNENFKGFKPYPYNELLQNLKSDQHINSLYVDDDGNMHIACERIFGKFIITKNGELLEKPYKNIESDIDESWLALDKTDDDTFFLSYTLRQTKNKKNTLYFPGGKHFYSNAISLPGNQYVVFTDGSNIYIATAQGKLLKKIEHTKLIVSLKPIDESTFFVGYDFGGGVFLDIEGTVKQHFLEEESITDFLIDHDGGYWFTSLHSGVFYIKEPTIQFKHTGISSPARSLTKNSKGELYVGYRSGDVLKLDAKHQISTVHTSNNNAKTFVEFDTIHKQLYVNSLPHFFREDKNGRTKVFNDSLFSNYTVKLSEPTEKGIFIAQYGWIGHLTQDGYKDYKMSYRIHDVVNWDDEIYFGSPDGAYLFKEGKISTLMKKDPLFQNRVDDIDVNFDREEIYFASLGAGIIVYDKKTEKVFNITQEDGLCSDIINEIHIENKNEIWACTNFGLNKIKFTENNTFQITGLKSSNGLLNDGISDVEIIHDTVWIASKKGLMYAPKQLFDAKTTTNSYHLRVKAFHINDSIATKEKLQNLSHQENRIEFLVEGIHFKASDELNYIYKMEGLDTKWYHTKNRSISYPSLPYGKYTFKVAASTSTKLDNLTFIEIPIQIHAPFWKRTWFIIAVIASIIVLIYLFFKYRILSYNRHIIRELLRLLVKKVKRKELYFSFKEAGKEIRIKTDTILYVKSAGNYVEVVTEQKNYTIRTKIGEFINLTPDPLEYIRIHRSYIVRIDKVAEKNSKEVTVNGTQLPVSNSYVTELDNLIF
ncbi:LytTR family transcriptional regulator DNA-binding domain-containing protein [uncultured Kordia sp.]|uniref:ligand-binding sensor domain-containing protein n=1 Tax=uncultured Kordia sp. TaxID=507699 RepID=UPI00261325ED|nr:LytTR family transcriptional regulator DNA-binding domain-containing protein [uncultured Kordia sp.]